MALGKDAPREGDLKPAAAITVIARDTALRGDVTGKASLRVEGKVAGSVAVDGTLEVAEGASVEAEVRASIVRIAGSVAGNVTATRLIELLATARVKGDLTAPALHVVEGASLEGRVVMAAAEKPAGSAPAAR
ncbi:MAG: bactofilin family protein [Acidobacteriota bacterium]